MLILPTKVQPGDLIAVEHFNGLIDGLSDLNDRLTKLEQPSVATAGTQITALLPSGTWHIGDTMHIIGQGFDVVQVADGH